jgi:putative endonuclease
MSAAEIIWTYALQFEDGTIYVGLTKNLKRRMEEHRRRQSPSTRRFTGAFRMIYQNALPTYPEARSHEKYLKSGPGRLFLQSVGT